MADEAAAKITKKIRREFRHNRLALFDELNVPQTRKHIKKLYRDVYKHIKQEFFAVVEPITREIYEEALALGFDGDIRDLDMAWVEEFFDEFNPVTKYVFSNELERKESRLFESLVASASEKTQSYATAERLIVGQIKQYAVELEDKIAKVVYEDTGVEKVIWVSEHDHRRCDVCEELDGEVYDLDKAPPKQHWQCRCYLMPYTGRINKTAEKPIKRKHSRR